MERSAELTTMVQQFYDGINRHEPTVVAALIAGDERALFVGTEGGDWWAGHDAIVDVLTEKLETIEGFELVAGEPTAYADGNVGWFADRPSFRLADGTNVPARLTGVALRDDGSWRVVQGHMSMGG